MNRENFDMDGAPNAPEFDGKKGKNKKGNKFILFLFFVLLILCIIAGYYYVTSSSNNSDTTTNTTSQTNASNQTSSIETLDTQSTTSNLNNTETSTNISDSNIAPVIDDNQNNSLALDISKVKSDKAKEGAVQFITHIVRANEDLNSIAALYGLKIQTLISVNDIKNISGIQEGVELTIPDRNGRYYTVKSGDMLSTIANEYAPNLGWKTLQEINGLVDTKLDVGDKIFIPDMSDIISNPTINRASNNFIVPTQGSIIAKYGQFIEDNPYNDDVSLNGVLFRTTTDVVASAKGVVVDIQNRNGKKSVKLSHEGSYESLYGNLSSTELNIGDEVEEGALIGNLSSDDNILYFEILQSGIPLDPESFI